MKISTAAFFVLVTAAILTDVDAYLSEAAIKKTLQMLKSVCTKKYQLEDADFAGLKKGEFPEDNNNLKCYFSCVFKTMQMVSPKGTLEKKQFKDKFATLAPPSVLEILGPAIEECVGNDKGDLCDITYNFAKCAYKVNPLCFDYLPL